MPVFKAPNGKTELNLYALGGLLVPQSNDGRAEAALIALYGAERILLGASI